MIVTPFSYMCVVYFVDTHLSLHSAVPFCWSSCPSPSQLAPSTHLFSCLFFFSKFVFVWLFFGNPMSLARATSRTWVKGHFQELGLLIHSYTTEENLSPSQSQLSTNRTSDFLVYSKEGCFIRRSRWVDCSTLVLVLNGEGESRWQYGSKHGKP